MERLLMKNPANSTAAVTSHPCFSPLLPAMGRMGEFTVVVIEYPATPAGRSPWAIKNMSKRYEQQKEVSTTLWQDYRNLRQLENFESSGRAIFRWNQLSRLINIYCPPTLADKLSQRYEANLGPLEVPMANKIAMSVLKTLDHLHRNFGIIHGEVCSHNVLVNETGDVIKLSGIGAASRKITQDRNQGSDMRSALYGAGICTAPEVLENEENQTTKADMYAFGLLVYSMLSCMPPHTFPGIQETAMPDQRTIMARYASHKADRVGQRVLQTIVSPCRQRKTARMSTAPLPPHLKKKQNETYVLTEQTTPVPSAVDNCLNFGCLGTRPPIPNITALGIDYNRLLAMYYICTKRAASIRPSALELIEACERLDRLEREPAYEIRFAERNLTP